MTPRERRLSGRQPRRQSIDEAGRQIQRCDAEQDAVDSKQRAQVAVDGATAGIRELMQAAVRLQKPQCLLQDPVTLLGREAQQRQAADDEIELVCVELGVELERVCGHNVTARKTTLE